MCRFTFLHRVFHAEKVISSDPNEGDDGVKRKDSEDAQGAFGKRVAVKTRSATAIFQETKRQEESENVGDEHGIVRVRLPQNGEKYGDDKESESEKAPTLQRACRDNPDAIPEKEHR